MKRGFTIVELLMVIGILAVLMTIVTTAATGAIRQARANKAEAIVSMIKVGLDTYYAQKGEWPGSFGSAVKNGIESNNYDDPDVYTLSNAEVDDAISVMVKESANNNPLMDITGLFVCRTGNADNKKAFGLNFMDAIHGTKRSPNKMKLADMCFGYPDTDTGHFRRLKIVYSIPSDSITVSKQ